jgi:hypothetical protein
MDASDKTAQRQLWDAWWYDRFEIPLGVPADAKRFELELLGERFGGVLLENAAPRTARAFWEMLPYAGTMIHCAWFGHAAFYLDRIELPGMGLELENRSTRLAPGDVIWDPYIKEITFAYGRHAMVNFPTTIYGADGTPHPNQACIFARIVENLEGFAVACKRLRYEGTKPMTARRVGD